MKEYTPAKANKVLAFLSDERRRLLDLEREDYVYSGREGDESEAPEYSYAQTRSKVADLDRKTSLLRHALHRFECETILPDAGITVDEARIRLGLMGKEKRRLAALRNAPRKLRVNDGFPFGGGGPEYEYANFDVAKAERDYLSLCEDIAELQLEIGLVNQTGTFAVDL